MLQLTRIKLELGPSLSRAGAASTTYYVERTRIVLLTRRELNICLVLVWWGDPPIADAEMICSGRGPVGPGTNVL